MTSSSESNDAWGEQPARPGRIVRPMGTEGPIRPGRDGRYRGFVKRRRASGQAGISPDAERGGPSTGAGAVAWLARHPVRTTPGGHRSRHRARPGRWRRIRPLFAPIMLCSWRLFLLADKLGLQEEGVGKLVRMAARMAAWWQGVEW